MNKRDTSIALIFKHGQPCGALFSPSHRFPIAGAAALRASVLESPHSEEISARLARALGANGEEFVFRLAF
jgi:hypothetical protein